MTTTNDFIADQFSLLSKLMDIHGENSFKTRSYSTAAFTIEKLPQPLEGLPLEQITAIKGIGEAIAKKIIEIVNTGELRLLKEYINQTPVGVIDMLRIKGLGPKKIATIWKEIGVESIGELLYACQENRLLLYKGFGEKTQANVRDAIEFMMKSQGSHLYAEVEPYARALEQYFVKAYPDESTGITGDFLRQLEIIDKLQFATTITPDALAPALEKLSLDPEAEPNTYKGPEGVRIELLHTTPNDYTQTIFDNSCSAEFLQAWKAHTAPGTRASSAAETSLALSSEPHSAAATSTPPPPFLREQPHILTHPIDATTIIQPKDIKAIIHSHSTWSDGSNTLEEMAAACIAQGFEYLVISDHSKSAFYANGLKEDRIKEQHAQIDELNKKLAPFVIFKSIECDILNDGALDYSDDILSTFDLVIASVHSNLKMSEEKAMLRLLKAIENPYTTILGHLTGRLLLSRPGYPVDHKAIIEACVKNKVVIELNAHPRRLDLDWRWISYALDQGALISIDPDAHSINGYNDIRYGTLAAQKAALTPAQNLSSFPLEKFKIYLETTKKKKGV